jgi:pilus assembly protein CpaB
MALVFGGSAAMGVRQLVGQAAPPTVDLVKVVVAAVVIPRGSLVTTELVKTRDYPRELLPQGAILKLEDVLDRSALATVVAGEPVLESKLSPRGQRGLATQIATGMRAITINTNVAAGVAGFILPGNKVDVLLTVNSGGGTSDPTGGGATTTLLQNVEILAVDQRIEAPTENLMDSKEMRSVTLLVTPDQAAKVELGQNKGTLHLSLRNPSDNDHANARPATMTDLRFYQEPPARPWDDRAKDFLKVLGDTLAQASRPKPEDSKPLPPPPRKFSIRTIRGGSVEQMVEFTAAATRSSDGG